jgi:hypothetical protein
MNSYTPYRPPPVTPDPPVSAITPSPALPPTPQSYSLVIRDGILERLKTVPTFSTVKLFAKNRGKGPIQNENIPFLACYFMTEDWGPDGDINAGAPKFTHRLKLGFSVIIQSNNNEGAEQNLDMAHWAIMNYLSLQSWWHFPMPDPWPDAMIEGVERGSRRHVFGNAGLNNETPIAELQMDLTFVHRTYFPPEVNDLFLNMHLTLAPQWPYDPGAYKPPAEYVFNIPQDDPTVPPPVVQPIKPEGKK